MYSTKKYSNSHLSHYCCTCPLMSWYYYSSILRVLCFTTNYILAYDRTIVCARYPADRCDSYAGASSLRVCTFALVVCRCLPVVVVVVWCFYYSIVSLGSCAVRCSSQRSVMDRWEGRKEGRRKEGGGVQSGHGMRLCQE